MPTLQLNICPAYPYECYTNFWDLYGHFYFYRTVASTETSKLMSAKLIGKVRLTKPADVLIFVNGARVVDIAGWSGIHPFNTDIGTAIQPQVGKTGTKSNEIIFKFSNVGFPFVGALHYINEAYLELVYTDTPPEQPTENPMQQSGTGLFGIENIDAIFALMMQLMVMMMMINVMTSVIGGFG